MVHQEQNLCVGQMIPKSYLLSTSKHLILVATIKSLDLKWEKSASKHELYWRCGHNIVGTVQYLEKDRVG